MASARLLVSSLSATAWLCAAIDVACYGILGPNAAAAIRAPPAGLPVNCGAGLSDRERDYCFMLCGVCSTPELAAWAPPSFTALCSSSNVTLDIAAITDGTTAAAVEAARIQGIFWLDDSDEPNATQAMHHLIAHMPRRDLQLLFAHPLSFIEFVAEGVRLALHTWAWASARGASWELFLNNVIPYAVLDEKRDIAFNWRPRFAQALLPLVAGATTFTDAMHIVAAAVPTLALGGALGMFANNGAVETVFGPPLSWHSEYSPAMLSVEQVTRFGGSCTGTGIVLVAAARSVGIPARLAGCGESVVRGDDHHWIEYFDASLVSPLGDAWHTKEGTSAGNGGGPWDAPSGPMAGCLAGVIPGNAMDNLWAADWSSDVQMPLLWANDTTATAWSRVGGVNRCGVYCTAWGCGVNNTQKWNQAQCGPA